MENPRFCVSMALQQPFYIRKISFVVYYLFVILLVLLISDVFKIRVNALWSVCKQCSAQLINHENKNF